MDDNPASLRLIENMLEKGNYHVLTATNGLEALDVLKASSEEIDLILLDRFMPQMDGIEFCKKIKADDKYRFIPVIMQTAAGRPEEIKEGIEAGVFYYLVKPLVPETLLSIVASAREKVRKLRQRQHEFLERRESMALVKSMRCAFRTIDEGEVLAAFLAQFFPNSEMVLAGISELFLNAVEHGNLEISYDEKSELVKQNRWGEEIAKRLVDPRFQDRQVTVLFEKKMDEYLLQIKDEGRGFNWQPYLKVDPSRATHNHGRGIAMARITSFDELVYNSKGDHVTCIVKNTRS